MMKRSIIQLERWGVILECNYKAGAFPRGVDSTPADYRWNSQTEPVQMVSAILLLTGAVDSDVAT